MAASRELMKTQPNSQPRTALTSQTLPRVSLFARLPMNCFHGTLRAELRAQLLHGVNEWGALFFGTGGCILQRERSRREERGTSQRKPKQPPETLPERRHADSTEQKQVFSKPAQDIGTF